MHSTGRSSSGLPVRHGRGAVLECTALGAAWRGERTGTGSEQSFGTERTNEGWGTTHLEYEYDVLGTLMRIRVQHAECAVEGWGAASIGVRRHGEASPIRIQPQLGHPRLGQPRPVRAPSCAPSPTPPPSLPRFETSVSRRHSTVGHGRVTTACHGRSRVCHGGCGSGWTPRRSGRWSAPGRCACRGSPCREERG